MGTSRAIVRPDRVEPAPEGGPLGVAVVAEIANWSSPPRPAANHLGVTLKIDGAAGGARGFVDLLPGGRIHKRFLHAFPVGGAAGAAAHEVEVEIDHDRFTLDDRRLAPGSRSRAGCGCWW